MTSAGQQNAVFSTGTVFSSVGGQSASGVETFDSLPTGYGPAFTTDFGTGGLISGHYAGANGSNVVQINSADQYGGAGGTGNYIVAFSNTPYQLNLSSQASVGGVNYFGYWLSALDAGNHVTFYGQGGQKLFTFNPQDVLNVVGGHSAYFGNPNAAFLGQDGGEPFVFVNFYDKTGSFSRVVFTETTGGGYESDNHTVGHWIKESTNGVTVPLSNAPEPAAWTMTLLGVGVLGAVLRRRRAPAAAKA